MYAEEPQDDYHEAVLKTIFQIHMKSPPGDVLVFLPGPSHLAQLAVCAPC